MYILKNIQEGMNKMFQTLKEINKRPAPFEFYTASELWTNEHTAQQMLQYHLNDDIEASSRNSAFIEKSCAWIADHFKIKGKKVIDFGCGPGLYASRLAQKGALVTGIDFSENSIEYGQTAAKEKGLSIHYVVSDYLDFETDEKFDLIIMIMCDFCALSPAQRKILLGKFKTILKPEGSIFMDVYSISAFKKKNESATYEKNQLYGFWSPNDYYAFVNTFKYEDDRVILDKYTIFEANREERIIYNWLQHFSFDSLQAELNKNGFVIKDRLASVDGGEFNAENDEFAVIAGH
jgi:2-polyprenyl-3-methyl-5-hydroxy-6-metoxy-1,4-benzoquinol methylase